MITQTDRLLEHPDVAAWRRFLDARMESGDVISYSNLRWHADWGITYMFVPAQPINHVSVRWDWGPR